MKKQPEVISTEITRQEILDQVDTNSNKNVALKKKESRTFIILILGALSTVTPFSIDMYLPSFSQIAKEFGTTPAKVALSLTSYFLGVAIGQIIYGPLLDRYGRKKPLYIGLILYIFACIGCMQSSSVEMLVAFRFVQALGGCVALVAAMSMVRDFFPVEESAKVFSLLMLVIGLSPLLAPTTGGFITASLGWHSVFLVLAVIVFLILMLVIFYLPQKYKPDPSVSLKPGPMIATFMSIVKNRQFTTYTLAGAFSFGALFIYLAGSPLIFMEIFHVSAQTYGGIFALLAVGFIGSNQLNIFALKKFKSGRIFRVGILAQLGFSIIFMIGAWNNWWGLTATVIMLFLTLSSIGFTYPNSSALALSPFNRNIGVASALIGFLQIGIAGLISSGVAILAPTHAAPIITMLAATALVAFLVLWLGTRKSGHDADIQPSSNGLPTGH